MDFVEYGATQGDDDEKPFFRFNDAAQIIFNEWLINLQTVKLPQEDNPLMLEHLGKYRSLLPTLALIFHCIELADGKAIGSIDEKNIQLAVSWVKYLESHARRIYATGKSPEHEAALNLSDKIKSKVLLSPFTCKTVYDKNWHGLTNKKEVAAACDILIEENWLRMVEDKSVSGKVGRPRQPEYHINPAVL
jgi:hypothetical protein